MDADWEAAKANGRARRQARESRDRLLVSLSIEGLSTDEIAIRLGADKRWLRRRCADLGIKGGKAGLRRLAETWIKTETRTAIEALAGERGVSVAEIVERVLANAFEDGAPKARALLRHDFLRPVETRSKAA